MFFYKSSQLIVRSIRMCSSRARCSPGKRIDYPIDRHGQPAIAKQEGQTIADRARFAVKVQVAAACHAVQLQKDRIAMSSACRDE